MCIPRNRESAEVQDVVVQRAMEDPDLYRMREPIENIRAEVRRGLEVLRRRGQAQAQAQLGDAIAVSEENHQRADELIAEIYNDLVGLEDVDTWSDVLDMLDDEGEFDSDEELWEEGEAM